MTTPETYPIEPAVLQGLAHEFGKVDKWFARGQIEAPIPAPGSLLAADDAVLTPYHLSHAAQSALNIAVDNLHALRNLVAESHLVHPWAPFTLLRASLENAATAVWLLAPRDRDQRLVRRLRLKWADTSDMLKANELIGHVGKRTREDHIARLQDLGRRGGLSVDQVSQVASRVIGYSTIMREAGEAAPTSFGPVVEATWMVCSGMAHGRIWAMTSLLDREQVGQSIEGVTPFRVTAPDEGLLTITQLTTSMIGYGWYLLDTKSKA